MDETEVVLSEKIGVWVATAKEVSVSNVYKGVQIRRKIAKAAFRILYKMRNAYLAWCTRSFVQSHNCHNNVQDDRGAIWKTGQPWQLWVSNVHCQNWPCESKDCDDGDIIWC